MLTSELVRARVSKGEVRASFLGRDAIEERCDPLLDVWRAHVGERRAEIDETLSALEGAGTDFQIWRGLSKVISDHSEFVARGALEPTTVRRVVFELAAGQVPADTDHRKRLLEQAAHALQSTVEAVEASLYADLSAREFLVAVPPWDGEELLHRYNTALAQSLLFKASAMRVQIVESRAAEVRAIFAALRFHGLMCCTQRDAETWVLDIDGPASVVSQARKYGLALAAFLPEVFHCPQWSIEAEIQWSPRKRVPFRLSHNDVELRPRRRLRGTWVSDEEKMLLSRFEGGIEGWTLTDDTTIVGIDRGQTLVCGYVLCAPDGRRVAVDVVGFWRKTYLSQRIKAVAVVDEPLVLVVSERLNVASDAVAESGVPVVFYKGVIRPAALIEAAERALKRRP